MNLTEKKKRSWRRSALYFCLAVFLIVGLRGFVLAWMMHGSYRLSSFLFDAVCTIGVLAMLQILDLVATGSLRKLAGDKIRWRVVSAKLVRFAIVIGIAGPFLLTTAQLHPPRIGCSEDPSIAGLAFTSHTITTDDGLQLAVWKIPADEDGRFENDIAPVVVLAHGLGANKQNFLPVAMILQELGYNVVTFDFRAHGDSQGHTCSLGVNEAGDVKAAYDFAVQEFPDRPVYAWSTSMGGAATMRATREYGIFDKVVVDATFTSLKNVAIETKLCYVGPFQNIAWQLCRGWYGMWVGRDIEKYGPIFDITEISHCPVFLIHGTGDEMIPSTESEKLKTAAPDAELWLVKDAPHAGAMQDGNYPYRLREFYDR